MTTLGYNWDLAKSLADRINDVGRRDIRLCLELDGYVNILDAKNPLYEKIVPVQLAVEILDDLLKSDTSLPAVDHELPRKQRILELAEKLLMAEYGNLDTAGDEELAMSLAKNGKPLHEIVPHILDTRSKTVIAQAESFLRLSEQFLKTGVLE